MNPKHLLPFAIALVALQLLAGGWQHARSYDPRLDEIGLSMRSAEIAMPTLHVSDWLVTGLEQEAAAGALQDPALGP
jgi:hypothetical protein